MPQKTETEERAQAAEVEGPPENKSATPPTGDPAHSEARSQRDAISAPRRRAIPGWAIIAALVVLAVVGYFVWNYYSTWESTDDAQVDVHINAVSARISGYISKVNVGDNQYVQAGTVLAEIDPRDYQAAADRAKADYESALDSQNAAEQNVPITTASSSSQLESARADVESARAGISAAEGQASAAKAQLAEAEANDVKAQSDLERYKQLVAKQEISQQQFDQAVAAAKASTATVEAARASAAAADQQVHQAQARLLQAQASERSAQTAPQQVAVSKAQYSSAGASVAQKKAALDQALLNLSYCTIYAPSTGVVDKNVEVGLNVQPGQQLFSVVPIDEVWVTADFKETQLKHMRPGQYAEVSVDAYGRKYKGHVDSIAGASGARFSLLPPENATGNYVKVVQRIPVKIILDPGQNNDHLLRPGMSVEPKVKVK